MAKKLFLYGVFTDHPDLKIKTVKFGQHENTSLEKATAYALKGSYNKEVALHSKDNVIFCEDVTDFAASKGFPVGKCDKFDDYVRNNLKNLSKVDSEINVGNHSYTLSNDAGQVSREVHIFDYSLTKDQIKESFVKSLHKFINGTARLNSFDLRPRQEEAVVKMTDYFNQGGEEFLLGAIMRFGKNFTFLNTVKNIASPGDNVLVLTNKPGVFDSLRDDIYNHVNFTDFDFIELKEEKDKDGIVTDPNKITVFAVSKQLTDNKVSGKETRRFLYSDPKGFKLAFFDECHSGTETENFITLNSRLRIAHRIWASGTPFKTTASGKFDNSNSYFYGYIEQQKDKTFGELPDAVTLEAFLPAVDPSLLQNPNFSNDEGFTLTKLFSVNKKGKLIFGGEVRSFLEDVLGISNGKHKYSPYRISDLDLSHTVWLMPSDVKMIEAVANIIEEISDYHVIVASGNNVTEINSVHEAIDSYEKTITLTNMRFVEGTTVPQWNGAFVLSDTGSVEKYFQFIFRAASPAPEKDTAVVFDFDPSRTFSMVFEFANGHATNTQQTDSQGVIKEWLDNFNIYRAGEGPGFEEVEVADILEQIRKGDYRAATLLKSYQKYINLGNLTNEIIDALKKSSLGGSIKVTTSATKNLLRKGSNYTVKRFGGITFKLTEKDQTKKLIEKIAHLSATLPLLADLEEVTTVEDLIKKGDPEIIEENCGMNMDIVTALIENKVIDTQHVNLYL